MADIHWLHDHRQSEPSFTHVHVLVKGFYLSGFGRCSISLNISVYRKDRIPHDSVVSKIMMLVEGRESDGEIAWHRTVVKFMVDDGIVVWIKDRGRHLGETTYRGYDLHK